MLVMTAMVCGFMACGNSKTPANQQEETEPVNVEATAELPDTDSDAVVVRSGSESEGFGRCLESGCYCKEFKGRGQTCQNCGHAYKRHY